MACTSSQLRTIAVEDLSACSDWSAKLLTVLAVVQRLQPSERLTGHGALRSSLPFPSRLPLKRELPDLTRTGGAAATGTVATEARHDAAWAADGGTGIAGSARRGAVAVAGIERLSENGSSVDVSCCGLT